jgi:hypothetical protein
MTFNRHGRLAVSWWGSTIPTTGPTGTTAIWNGLQIKFLVPGVVAGFRHYLQFQDQGGSLGYFADDPTGTILGAFHWHPRTTGQPAWHQCWSKPYVRVNTTDDYFLYAMYVSGLYYQNTNALTSPVAHNNIQLLKGWTQTGSQPFTGLPTFNNNAYGIDVLFYPDA